MEHTCPKCNTLMKISRLLSYGSAYVTVRKEPEKLLGNKESAINSYVCPNCGFIELYAQSPEKFR